MTFKLPEEMARGNGRSWLMSESDSRRTAALELAEAIVRHCAKVCKDAGMEDAILWDDERVLATAYACADAILREYGIEP